KAESLCKLLRYLADHALAQPGVPLKEYQIATEVFGRSEDFDPQSDSAIRVQAGRLRLKLVDYYSHEGVNDTVIVEIPNGSYTLSFHERETPVVSLPRPPFIAHPPVEIAPPPPRLSRGWTFAIAALLLLLVAALLSSAILFMELSSARAAQIGRAH